jgi:dihydropteroate synthase
MGILNVTPDSFSDGGHYLSREQMLKRIVEMHQHGAHIIDIGGESTRPGADAVSLDEELSRVMPAIELAKAYTDCWVSVDTYKPEVMREALSLNVDMINDVNALLADGALSVCAKSQACICLMHKKGQPKDMQSAPTYMDVYAEVKSFLLDRVEQCVTAGLPKNRLVIDPGFGFGKTLGHNVDLFQSLHSLTAEDLPVLVGVSRKTLFSQIIPELKVDERLIPSVIAAVLAIQQGASIVRVHDVKETKQAILTYQHLLTD